jgi:transposase-like protein
MKRADDAPPDAEVRSHRRMNALAVAAERSSAWRNVKTEKAAPAIAGDVWTWTAIDADTKLLPSWMIGDRSGDTARAFIADLPNRLVTRAQLTSDGHKAISASGECRFRRRHQLCPNW